MTGSTTALLGALACVVTFFSSTTDAALTRRANMNAVMGGQNLPDPSIIRTGDGWHAFSTRSLVNNKRINIPIAFTKDYRTWTFRGTKDAMPNLAHWVDKNTPNLWAPDVNVLPDGSFILYYTAALAGKAQTHCLGWATSKNVEGPYVDKAKNAWICPQKQGGAIDIDGFFDQQSGKRYVVYKIDGNSIGHGGECGNTVKPVVPTPIMLQEVNNKNGHDLIGGPKQLITNGPLDGPYVEAPSLTKLNGKYVLFFSSQCYATPKYDVSYAISNNVAGPYTKYGPLFVTGTSGLTAPGGLDIADNGDHAVFHANVESGRAMFQAILRLEGTRVIAST